MLALLAAATLGYLLGSIPFGLVLTKLAGLGDIRDIGSGNIGATNVLRTGRKDLALATLLLDSGKGGIAVLIAYWAFGYGSDAAIIAGCAAFLGHVFPVWLGFKGGKGVATYLGTLGALAWPAGLVACAIWLIMAVVFRYSSLSALTAALLSPIAAYYVAGGKVALAALFLAALLIYRHETNIRRLLKGEEPKIGKKKTEDQASS